MAPRKKNKMLLKFRNAHKLRFGLKVTGVNPDTKEVTSCACRFCLTFGREEKVSAKRKPTERVKYFESFRTDNYAQHLKLEHTQKWVEYQMLKLDQDKEAFFQEHQVPFINTIESHFDKHGCLFLSVNKGIVDVIIG
eukprot:IDg20290t1